MVESAMMCDSYDWYLSRKQEALKHGGAPHKSAVRQGVLSLAKHLV